MKVAFTTAGTVLQAPLDPRFGRGIAAENSGRLVSMVRREARRLAVGRGSELLLVDGPPGIGCPVIASLTGTAQALVVTEPTVAGEHDLARVLALARHFQIPAAVCVNKWDVNAGPRSRPRRRRPARSRRSGIAGCQLADEARPTAGAVTFAEAPAQ